MSDCADTTECKRKLFLNWLIRETVRLPPENDALWQSRSKRPPTNEHGNVAIVYLYEYQNKYSLCENTLKLVGEAHMLVKYRIFLFFYFYCFRIVLRSAQTTLIFARLGLSDGCVTTKCYRNYSQNISRPLSLTRNSCEDENFAISLNGFI